MVELRNKCVELSELVFKEIDKLTEEEQDKIYNADKSSQLSEKDGKVYILNLLYESLNQSVMQLNKIEANENTK